MDTFIVITILVTVNALISYFNYHYVKLSGIISVMVIAITLSIPLIGSTKTLLEAILAFHILLSIISGYFCTRLTKKVSLPSSPETTKILKAFKFIYAHKHF